MRTSVLMSAYKGEKYIRQQLDSIVEQTQTPDEVIIVDDCSPDKGATVAIVKEYQDKYDYIKLYVNPCNMGWAASFMNGLSYVTGDILFFADQDDIWSLNKIERMSSLFRNEIINGVISDCQNVDMELNPLNKCTATGSLLDNKFPFDKHFIYPKGVGAAMAFRMNFINKYKHLWVKGFGHDRFFQVMLVLFDRQYYLDLPLIRHIMHGDNATTGKSFESENRIRTLNGNIQLLNVLLESDLSKKLTAHQIETINSYNRFAIARREMLQNKSFFRWIMMASKDLSFYPTRNTWFGDLRCIKK